MGRSDQYLFEEGTNPLGVPFVVVAGGAGTVIIPAPHGDIKYLRIMGQCAGLNNTITLRMEYEDPPGVWNLRRQFNVGFYPAALPSNSMIFSQPLFIRTGDRVILLADAANLTNVYPVYFT